MNRNELEYTASSLYDGGWRAQDRDQLISEYDLTESDADYICDLLKQYANN